MTISVGTHPAGSEGARGAGDQASLENLLHHAVRRAADCARLDIAVTDGIVVLSGVVPCREDKSRAGFACWCDPSIRAVYNNMTIGSGTA